LIKILEISSPFKTFHSHILKITHFFYRKGLTNSQKFAAKPIDYINLFQLEAIFMLPVFSGGHSAYQDFVVQNLRKYYPNPDAIARSTWDIIDRFWNLDLSFTDEFMKSKYSIFGPRPRIPSCMQRSYLLSIDFKVTSLTDWAAQLKINPLYAPCMVSKNNYW